MRLGQLGDYDLGPANNNPAWLQMPAARPVGSTLEGILFHRHPNDDLATHPIPRVEPRTLDRN